MRLFCGKKKKSTYISDTTLYFNVSYNIFLDMYIFCEPEENHEPQNEILVIQYVIDGVWIRGC